VQLNMTNVANTEEYRKRAEYYQNQLFAPEYFVDEEHRIIDDDISVLERNYARDRFLDDYSGYPYVYHISGSESIVFEKGAEIFSFKTVHFGRNVQAPITHQDGKKYLIFKKDMYGHSVLDLASKEVFDYFPAESFHEGETFIWCSIHYNPLNNIMAVEGCYWAAPYSIVLVDFSHPMKECVQVDTKDFINPGYAKYGHIDFVEWRGKDLVLQAETNTESEQKELLIISEAEYMEWLAKEKTLA